MLMKTRPALLTNLKEGQESRVKIDENIDRFSKKNSIDCFVIYMVCFDLLRLAKHRKIDSVERLVSLLQISVEHVCYLIFYLLIKNNGLFTHTVCERLNYHATGLQLRPGSDADLLIKYIKSFASESIRNAYFNSDDSAVLHA